MAVTLRTLAQAAGVSVATVSRALSNSPHRVNDQTQQRIVALAQELGYRPNVLARGLRTERSFSVGLIVDNIISPFSPTIIRGIQDQLAEQHYFSIIINGDFDPAIESEAVHHLISRSIDGIIFVEPQLRGRRAVLDLENKPYVFVHRLFSSNERNVVMVDERYGAHLAVEHLLALGHRRIAFINGPQEREVTGDRLFGYQEALAQYGVVVDGTLVRHGDWEIESGYATTHDFLRLDERPTAIFAANDLMAVGAIYAIQDAGFQVPADVAVVGYDDREIASLLRPTVTTVTLPCYEMGQTAARLLLRMLDSGDGSDISLMIRGHLIVRESSGAPAGKRPLARASRASRRRRRPGQIGG